MNAKGKACEEIIQLMMFVSPSENLRFSERSDAATDSYLHASVRASVASVARHRAPVGLEALLEARIGHQLLVPLQQPQTLQQTVRAGSGQCLHHQQIRIGVRERTGQILDRPGQRSIAELRLLQLLPGRTERIVRGQLITRRQCRTGGVRMTLHDGPQPVDPLLASACINRAQFQHVARGAIHGERFRIFIARTDHRSG